MPSRRRRSQRSTSSYQAGTYASSKPPISRQGTAPHGERRSRGLLHRKGRVPVLVGVARAAPAGVVGREVVDQEQLARVGGETRQPAELKRPLVLAVGGRQAVGDRAGAVHLDQPGRHRRHAGVGGEGARDRAEGLAFGPRVGIQEQQHVRLRRGHRLIGRGSETAVLGVDEDRDARPERLEVGAQRAAGIDSSVVHHHERHARSVGRHPRAGLRERRDRLVQVAGILPGDVDDRDLADHGEATGQPDSRRDRARSPSAQKGTRGQTRRGSAIPVQPTARTCARSARRIGKQVPREEGRLEVPEQGSPAIARRPQRPAKRRAATRQRALVPRRCPRVAGESPAGPGQPEGEVHVLVVGEVGVLERRAGLGALQGRERFERSPPVQRRGRRDPRDREGPRGRRVGPRPGQDGHRLAPAVPLEARRVDPRAVIGEHEALCRGEATVPRQAPRRAAPRSRAPGRRRC